VEEAMSKNKTAGMSAAEKRAYYLSRLYIILPIISVLLLVLLWTTVAGKSDFPSPKDTWDRLIQLF
jgi:competence protein ComGC